MRSFLKILLVICTIQSLYSQSLPFDVYCNKVKITDNNFTGYFCPQEFEFKFNSKDTLCKIRSGFVVYTLFNEEQQKCVIDSNYVLSDIQVVGKKVDIEINKIEKWKSGLLIQIDTVTYKYSINFIHSSELKDDEIQSINNNSIEFKAGGSKLNPIEGFNRKKGSLKWVISDAENKINEWEVVLVRGDMPVAQRSYTNSEEDISFFSKYIQKGDFFRIKIYLKDMKTSKEKVLYKIIKVV